MAPVQSNHQPRPDCPYVAGSELVLTLVSGQTAQAKIVEVMRTTNSCVMTIQLESSPEIIVLKAFDRRYAERLRGFEDLAPWDWEIETDFQELENKDAMLARWTTRYFEDPHWHRYRDDTFSDDENEEFDQETFEARVEFLCQLDFHTETRAYDLLSDMQGVHVPKFLGQVSLKFSKGPGTSTEADNTSFECPGILMQHIDGFLFDDLGDRVDSQYWRETCETAIDIIHRYHDLGICNRMFELRSFIMRQDSDSTAPQLFLVGWGWSLFRGQAKDDREFREWKNGADEETEVGLLMDRRLGRRVTGAYNWVLSQTALDLAAEFNKEEGPMPEGWYELMIAMRENATPKTV